MTKRIFCLFLLVLGYVIYSQSRYTRADTLRGSLRRERNYDVLKYHLDIRLRTLDSVIYGSNTITFSAEEKLKKIQIDLFENLKVDTIIYRGQRQHYTREYNAVFIHLNEGLRSYVRDSITVYYSGRPEIARRAPWDGGIVFSKDSRGKSWIATACEGIGAGIWWPTKDHQSDEPQEGALIQVAVPNGLMNVSNGRFIGKKDLGDGFTRWDWKVVNPINNYDISINIADYVHFHDNHKGLDLDYYVLRENLEKAKKHFEEVKPMMDCFQDKFGDYPFPEDGYKMVETPFLGMEHQSAIAYGNHYKNGYLGRDLSLTGVGLRWDYIIVHESGHEWFGNSITSADIADLWIHEGFTTYSEAVYVECRWGYRDSQDYINGQKKKIDNRKPIIGDYGVNSEGSRDMYFKGSAMLNTIRHIIADDKKWWQLIRDFSEHFRHRIVTTDDVIGFFDKKTAVSLKPVFDQYLKYANIPKLELKAHKKSTLYRWKTDVENFEMPVEATVKGKNKKLHPTNEWKKLIKTKPENIEVNTAKFYVIVSTYKD